MHDQDRGQLTANVCRANQIPSDTAVALGRGHGGIFGLDSAVVFGNLLRPSVIRAKALPYCCRGYAADSELLRAIQEFAPFDIAVNVTVKQVQQFLREIGSSFSFHLRSLLISAK